MLTLCMIVRNEEANLPRVLRSVEGLVDERVIVDTGSTDRTVEVAESWGARVDRIEWRDDFAAARNHSLSLAKSDWILVLDADDEFERADIPRARRLLESTTHLGIAARHIIAHPNGPVVNSRVIFFRNLPRIRYVFRVHEWLPLTPEEGVGTSLRLYHHGYTKESLPGKRARNFALLRRMKDDPDPRARVAARYHLGMMLEKDGLMAEAHREYADGAYSGVPTEFRLLCTFRLARLSLLLGDAAYAETLHRSLAETAPGLREPALGLADVLLRRGALEEARLHFEKGMSSERRLFSTFDPVWEEEVRRRFQRIATNAS